MTWIQRISSEIGRPYRRAIVVMRWSPRRGEDHASIAHRFGLGKDDFLWVTNHPSVWRKRIVGLSRATLVLDPNTLTRSNDDIASGIIGAFDNIVIGAQCVGALAGWLRTRNPPLYDRMIAAGVVEPCAGDAPAIEQEVQQPLDPERHIGAAAGVSLGLSDAAA